MKLEWIAVMEEEERSAIEVARVDELQLEYEILPNAQTSLQEVKDFMVNRTSLDYKYENGIIGKFENEIGVCCGISRFCANGLPPNGKCNGNMNYIKCLAEMDLKNLEKGIDNLFVHKFLKRNNGDQK